MLSVKFSFRRANTLGLDLCIYFPLCIQFLWFRPFYNRKDQSCCLQFIMLIILLIQVYTRSGTRNFLSPWSC